MEIASFEKFLVDKIKVQGKTGEHLLLPSLGLVCVCCAAARHVAVVCTACVCCPSVLGCASKIAVRRLTAARQQRMEREGASS